jgi:uncharacterized protein (TIGR02452 family)
MDLKKIADETKAELPQILATLSGFNANESSLHGLEELAQLDAKDCPRLKLTHVKVFDIDTFDAALALAPSFNAHVHNNFLSRTTNNNKGATSSEPSKTDTEHEEDIVMQDATAKPYMNAPTICFAPSANTSGSTTPRRAPKPVAVLNLASERHAGGGWQNGALAQEETLCYRSSLYLSLHKSHYPLPSLSAIYSPSVLIIRDAMSRGHSLLTPGEQPADLPVTSVISVAALRHPTLTAGGKKFKNEGQRAETKRKIRLTLRLAAHKGHTKLVLGALGCGVFSNPPTEVAECFLEVFQENEFQGGWWEDVVFAILDNVRSDQGGENGIGNFGIFYRVLDGQAV